jgi:hypothetical protein
MQGLIVMGAMILFLPYLIIIWNKQRTKGKMLCMILREDKSVLMKLCELRDAWVIFQDRAYDVYPDFIRVCRFPSGWPGILQELVPAALYDEEDGIPLDWINLDNRLERSMELKAALDENWLRKLVKESATEGGSSINWRKIIPYILMGVGLIGLVYVLTMSKGCTLPKLG